MVAIILILRPQPGADATAGRARNRGMEAVVAPLFSISKLDWQPPDRAEVDAAFLTSANAARAAGPAITPFLDLACFAVGEATAAAAREAGFANVRTGRNNAAALLELAVEGGVRRALHLCGRDHIPIDHPGLRLIRRIVYASEPAAHLPERAHEAIASGALVLLHSPRAAATFASLVDKDRLNRGSISVAAISPPALAAAGEGWKLMECAASPRDEALLELAAKLCKT